MKIRFLFLVSLINFSAIISAQTDTTYSTFWKPVPRNYDVKQAFEVESLFPMFFTGGFHAALGFRHEKLRVRVSVINGGDYDAEPAGTKNSSPDYKRYYKTSPGLFLGYNVWKHLEVYSFIEFHTFEIVQRSSGLKNEIHSTDIGGGVSYQFFFGKHIYLQPGLHIYLRGDKSANFNGATYNIPNADLAPVIRIGYRVWSKF